MTPTSLEAQIRTAALAFPGLTAFLGGTDPNAFRWFDTQLLQGTAFPAVVVSIISDPQDYVFERRLVTSWQRVQFDIWSYDPEQGYQIQEEIAAFLDQFNGYGTPNLVQYANQIVNVRKVLWPEPGPPQYQRIIDVKMFFNSTS